MTWKVLTASIAGASHCNVGMGCQDAVLTSYPNPTGTGNASEYTSPPLFCAVADGLGSRPHSAVAANLGVSALVDSLVSLHSQRFAGSDLAPAVDSAAALMHDAFDEAEERVAYVESTIAGPGGIAQYSAGTTLAGVWLDQNFVAIATVGDSFVASIRRDGTCALLAGGVEGDGYSNETDILVGPSGGRSRNRDVLVVYDPEIVGVVLSTDGLSELALAAGDRPKETVAHPGFFVPLYDRVVSNEMDGAKLTQLVSKMGERTADDCTLAVAWRVE